MSIQCIKGHTCQEHMRVCPYCGAHLPVQETLGSYRVLAARRVHDFWVYQAQRDGTHFTLVENWDPWPHQTRLMLSKRLQKALASTHQPLLDFGQTRTDKWCLGYQVFSHRLWEVLEHGLSTRLESVGLLEPSDLEGLVAYLSDMRSALASQDLVNPGLCTPFISYDDSEFYALDWLFCAPRDHSLPYHRQYIGYHPGQASSDYEKLAYSAMKMTLLEAVLGKPVSLWYPDDFDTAPFQSVLSHPVKSWMQNPWRSPFPEQTYVNQATQEYLKRANLAFYKGYSAYVNNNWETALLYFEWAAREHLNDPLNYLFLGKTHLAMGELSKAKGCFERGLRIHPLAVLHHELAECELLLNQPQKALHQLDQALEQCPTYPEAHFSRAKVWGILGQESRQEADLKKAFHLRPSDTYRSALQFWYQSRHRDLEAQKLNPPHLGSSMRLGKEVMNRAETPAETLERERQIYQNLSGCFEKLQLLSRPHHGKVRYRFSAVYDNTPVVLDVFDLSKNESTLAYERLKITLRALSHPHLLLPSLIDEIHDCGVMVYPLQEKTRSLLQILQEEGAMEPLFVWQVLITLTSVIAYLQSFETPLVHGDITPANILCDASGHLYLTDFETMLGVGQSPSLHLGPKTWPYAPPELMTQGKVSQTTDAYALGVTVLHLASGVFPELYWSYPQERFLCEDLCLSAALTSVLKHLTAVEPSQRLEISSETPVELLTQLKALEMTPVQPKQRQISLHILQIEQAQSNMEWPQMKEAMDQLLRLSSHKRYLYYVGSVYFRSGMFAQAFPYLKKGHRVDPCHVQNSCLLAEVLLAREQFEQAQGVLQPILAYSKGFFLPYLLWGKAMSGLEQWKAATAAFQKALELHPEPFVAVVWINHCLRMNRFEDVKKCAYSQLKTPGRLSALEKAFFHEKLAMTYAAERCFEKAVACFQAAADHVQHHPQILFQWGLCEYELGHWKQAEGLFKRALKVQPAYPEAEFQLALCHIALFQFQSAYELLNTVQQSGSVPDESLWFHKARCLCLMGRYEAAIEHYQQSFAIRPMEPTMINLANTLIILERYKEADALLNQVSPHSVYARELRLAKQALVSKISDNP